MSETSAIDAAIAGFFRNEDDESERALAATGDAGARRVLSIWFGDNTEPFDSPLGEVSGREALDLWYAVLSIVAAAAPAAFIDSLDGKELTRPIVVALGGADDPRASTILAAQLTHDDWLIRYNAVGALGRRNDPAARPFIESALDDPNLVVRVEAIKVLSRWDPDRALSHYEQALTADDLTPLLRASVRAAISDLRAGRPVRDQ